MTGARVLVVATGNRGKLAELRALLAGDPVRVLGVAEALGEPPEVVEDGDTFAANATKKALIVAQATKALTLADDSGLEVDVLGGRPGVRSARFAGEHATDAENCAALVAALRGEEPDGRDGSEGFRARFRCVLALLDPPGPARIVEGACQGAIVLTPRGSSGFGYDPLFVVAGGTRTMAELGEAEKNRVSHRARAFAALRPVLA
ncbi:MAG TPA: RdgB/HAM1 family non-canonical purine NTP pyrophosphatase, partial [Polyangiaceae bacterium]|nr:RdgB/HAM1 family non-canonical purine NTP pyrophosphatase [Polyangiaceae bacterium]